MTDCPMPANEEERLKVLHSLKIVDTAADQSFDRITRILAVSLGAPIAIISLIDQHRQWFKSKVGLNFDETPRGESFCTHCAAHGSYMEIHDATKDDRFSSNIFVTGDAKIRFYAGAPLMVGKGLCIGTLCVMDTIARVLDDKQRALLNDMAGVVMDLFKKKMIAEQARRAE